jgi:hypothetical protein
MKTPQFIRTTLLLAGLSIALCGTSARAQYEDGSLIGSIHDATGAAVPNAAITVTNIDTGNVIHVSATSSGDYEIPSLRVGLYNIEATAPSFAPAEARNITVSVASRERIDLTLKVGNADATTVEVSDVALQLETETSERGESVSEYQTESLPLVSRNYSDLLALVTGSRQAPTEQTTTAVTSLVRGGSYNVNGLRSMFNNFLLDGMDNNAYGESNQGFDNQIIQPPPDSISQFQVVTNNESAEYGRSAGATVNVATKSGTNGFHTTAYEFLRNTDLNAFGYIHAVSGTHPIVKPGFDRNQFGIDFGGPIKNDKLFFFLDYEGFRQKLTPSVVLTVPTENELGVGLPGPELTIPVKDPISGVTYAANTPIPLAAVNSTTQEVLKFFTLLPSQCQIAPGSAAIAASGIGTNDCPTNAPFTDNADKGNLRIDFQQGNRHQLSHAAPAARRPDQRPYQDSRSAGCAGLYPPYRRQQGTRCASWALRHASRKVLAVDRRRRDHLSRSAHRPDGCRRPSLHGNRQQRDDGIRPPEHQPAVAESLAARSQGQFLLDTGKAFAQIRLRIRAHLDGSAGLESALRFVYLQRRLQRRLWIYRA